MILSRVKRKLSWWLSRNRPKLSYSQCGEDLIADFVFRSLGIRTPSYLDIGAYDPIELSNTYFFYSRGSCGVCVEPNPKRIQRIERARSRDLCLNVGVGPKTQPKLDFYVLSQETLSTFSKSEAARVCAYGNTRIKKTLSIPVVTLPDLIEKHNLAVPDFLSIDLEGDDLSVLQSTNFQTWRPKVMCVETLTYTENKTERKQIETIDWLKTQGYMVYGDTYINSIFVDRTVWGESLPCGGHWL